MAFMLKVVIAYIFCFNFQYKIYQYIRKHKSSLMSWIVFKNIKGPQARNFESCHTADQRPESRIDRAV